MRRGLRPRVAASIIATVWIAAVIVFGVVEYLVDRETFDSVWLAMWWATQTVTTVGYGDVVPDPWAGKLVATILMIGGLSLFAVITGLITSGFVAVTQARREVPGAEVARRLEEMTSELAVLSEKLDRLSGGRD